MIWFKSRRITEEIECISLDFFVHKMYCLILRKVNPWYFLIFAKKIKM